MCKCGSNRIASVNAKCSDLCNVQLPSGEELDGYVPDNLNIGGGDYIRFEFCMDCGRIQDEFPTEEESGCGEKEEGIEIGTDNLCKCGFDYGILSVRPLPDKCPECGVQRCLCQIDVEELERKLREVDEGADDEEETK